jgi:hypothetical protein
MISDVPSAPGSAPSAEEVARLAKRVTGIGSIFLFWCGFRAAACLALIFTASDRDVASHRLFVVLMMLVFAGAAVLGWLVKTQANRSAARLLLLLPLALGIFVVVGRHVASQPAMIRGLLFVAVYTAGAVEAIRVTNRIYELPGVNLVL